MAQKNRQVIRAVAIGFIALLALAGCSAGGPTLRAGDAPVAPVETANEAPEAVGGASVVAPESTPEPSAGSATVIPRNAGAVALEAQAADERAAGQLERAAATLERALRIAPNDSALWLALGETRLDQGRPDLAESLARRAASLAGNDPDNARSAQALLERSRRAR